MAALQQTPVAYHARSPISARLLSPKPIKISFSASFPSLKFAGKSKLRRGGGARMADSPAINYASALADVAVSNGTLETTSADLEKISKIFSDDVVYKFFINPVIAPEKKRQVIDDITESSKLQPHTSNFLKLLVDSKRINVIREIVEEFEIVFNKLTETELAVVTSVVKLDAQHLAQIAKGVQRLSGLKNVRIKTVIDPSLVAGFTIRYGNAGSKLIDMSVKKQLAEIAEQLDLGEVKLAV